MASNNKLLEDVSLGEGNFEDDGEESFATSKLAISEQEELHPTALKNSEVEPSPQSSQTLLGQKETDTEDDMSSNISDRTNECTSGDSGFATGPASPNNAATMTDVKDFFGVRPGALEEAVNKCKPVILKDIDGELNGVWLLAEIDHWDNEKERLVFLTTRTLIVLKYDFITLKLLSYKRYDVLSFVQIKSGQLKYPESSFIPDRNQNGIRIIWNRGDLPLTTKWNPWSNQVPWITLASHPLLSNKEVNEKGSYDIDDFRVILLQNLQHVNDGCQISNEPILIENYVNLVSAVHNLSNFGYFKSRGKLSF